MSRLRSSLLSFFVLALCLLGTAPTSAQSLDAVLEQMHAVYHQQFDAVDTYVVKTNLYTSYNKQLTADSPIVVTVDSVSVNAPLPDDAFDSGSVR